MTTGTSEPFSAADSSKAGLTAQLREEWAELLTLGTQLTDHDWAAATACPGWSVADQYAHIIGTESALLRQGNTADSLLAVRPDVPPRAAAGAHVRNEIGIFNEAWVAALAADGRDAVLARLAEVTAARLEFLDSMTEHDFESPSWSPVGMVSYRRFMQIRVFDCWVHEQDIRSAAGRPGHQAGAPAEQSVDEIVRAFGYLVGKRARFPDGSSVTVALTGPLQRTLHAAVRGGRARVAAALDRTATATLSLSSQAFIRLACGRIGPEAVLSGALGGVQFSGDEELGRRLLANLSFTI